MGNSSDSKMVCKSVCLRNKENLHRVMIMKKRKFPVISLTLSILSMLAVVVLIVDMVNSYIDLSSRPTSGSDWFLFGITMVFCVPAAVFGGVSSCFCGIKTSVIWVKVVSFIMLFGFGIALIISLSCFGGSNNAIEVAAWLANLFIGG